MEPLSEHMYWVAMEFYGPVNIKVISSWLTSQHS